MNNLKSFKKSRSVEEKIKLLIAYYSTPEPERGAFLRTQGILFSQIENWSKNPTDIFIGADMHSAQKKRSKMIFSIY